MLASFKIRTVFCDFAMYWQSKHYENKGKLWSEITLKNHAICVKLPNNLLHFTMLSDADSNVISIRLQHKMIEMNVSKPWKSFAQAWKAHFHFYLVSSKSVKNEEENKQNKIYTFTLCFPCFFGLKNNGLWFSEAFEFKVQVNRDIREQIIIF